MRNYIILNGKNSNEINGLLIQELPPISKPQIRTEIEEIDGRDGDIVTKLGFAAYDKEISVGLYKDFDINEIIAYFNSEGTIVFSNEPDKYYNYQIIDQIDFERLVRYRTATIRMHCQPFKYSTTQGTITKDASATVSDEGSNLVLENTAEAPFKKLEPKGNAEQKTLSGKNLSNIYTIPNQIAANLKVNVADEKITISDNANAIGYTNTTIKLSVLCPTLQVGDTVYLFFDTTSSSTQKDNIYIQGTGANIYWAKATSKTITQAMLDANIILYGGHDETAVISNFMITATNDSTYEKYVGGIPAPNPDFPQVVNTVSGEQTVKIVGKNLLDFDAFLTAGGATYTKSGDVYSITDSAYIYSRQYPLYLENGKTYTLSQEYQPQSSTAVRLDILKNGSTYASSYATDQNNLVKTFTADGSNYTLRVNWSVKTYPIMFNCPMLEISPSKTNFEPYQGQIYEVNLGKNLAEIVPKTSASNGILATYDATTGNITLSGTATTSYSLPFQTLDVNIPAGTYTLKQYGTLSHGRIGVNLRRADNTQITEQLVNTSTLSNTFTLTEPAQKIHLLTGGHVANESVEGTIQVMLQAGSTAGTFAKYKTPLELCKIGDYADEPVKVDGTWYIRRAIGKVVFDGSNDEGWWLQSGTTNQMRAPISGTLAGAPLMSDYFHNSSSESELGAMQIYLAGYLRAISNQTSANDFKTWLSTHPTTVYYALATPTDEEITDSELIEQLEALAEAHSYKGHTHITATAADGNAPAVLSVEVGEDNESTVTNSGNINSKPVIKIYGSGNIGAYLNDIQILQIALGDEGYITIDTNLMEAYKDTLDNLKNRLVTGDYSKFSLKPGANKIHFSGTVTKYEISKYSRWL